CPLCEANISDMHNHVGLHILRSLSNMPEEPPLKEPVGIILPCSFCGRSRMSECAITIIIPNNAAPTWTTTCMYKHIFRYGSVDVGSKTTPCRNIPLKCELCYPVLPPEPGKASRKTAAVYVDVVWHYNMPEHILSVHEEYSVPGCREAGVTLPAHILRVMGLTELEQKATHIPPDRWKPSYDDVEKENIPASSSRQTKRSVIAPAVSLPAKQPCIATQPLLTARTLVV
ncbi:hypothetical protein CY34DRAFT_95703, partial [Suillus luteus UH-Slu-Lm8-n1]